MAVTLTEKAVKEINRIIQEDGTLGGEVKVRVGVAGGGCSGFQYTFQLDQNFDETKDNLYVQHGLGVIVDKKSALYLDGTTVDFYEGLDQRGFKFDNPSAKRSCGCGSSFQV
jgi:iron-sulfur cluster assembly protein